jgi:transposase
MTRRTALGLLADLFGLPISLGGLSGAERRIAEALKPAYDEAAEALAKADVANLDETPMREPGKKPYMWLATCPAASYYMIADRRDTEAYLRLGLPAGQVKGTDRYTVYVSQVPVELHAVCWSHLGREFRGWEGDARAKAIARWLSRQTELLFSHWHAFKAGECDRDGLAERMEPVQKEVLAALRWGAGSGIPKFQGMCRNLLARWGSLWTFLRVEGVEPTNNAAERAVRRAVLWRKTSLFVQSERGRRYVERVLTVGETLKKQGRGFIGFVEASLRAARSGLPPPKLFEPAPA